MFELAYARCLELVAEAKAYDRNRYWIEAQLFGEFYADCAHVVDSALTNTKALLD